MVIYRCVYGNKKSPRIKESGKFLLLELGIPLMIGIRNPSSTDKESRIFGFLGATKRDAANKARKNCSVQMKGGYHHFGFSLSKPK